MAEYAHREAFCIMHYESKEEVLGIDSVRAVCRRLVWNSRDGVTPFGFIDPETEVELTHTNWAADKCVPDFDPPDDILVWVTVHPSLDDCRAKARKAVEANPQYAPPPDDPLYEKFIERLAKNLMTSAGESGQPGLTTGLDYKKWLASEDANG